MGVTVMGESQPMLAPTGLRLRGGACTVSMCVLEHYGLGAAGTRRERNQRLTGCRPRRKKRREVQSQDGLAHHHNRPAFSIIRGARMPSSPWSAYVVRVSCVCEFEFDGTRSQQELTSLQNDHQITLG